MFVCVCVCIKAAGAKDARPSLIPVRPLISPHRGLFWYSEKDCDQLRPKGWGIGTDRQPKEKPSQPESEKDNCIGFTITIYKKGGVVLGEMLLRHPQIQAGPPGQPV